MRTKEQHREYMKSYMKRYRLKTPNSPRITLKTPINKPYKGDNNLIQVDDWLLENVNTEVFNVIMVNPKSNKRLTYYGTQIGLQILGNIGFLIEDKNAF